MSLLLLRWTCSLCIKSLNAVQVNVYENVLLSRFYYGRLKHYRIVQSIFMALQHLNTVFVILQYFVARTYKKNIPFTKFTIETICLGTQSTFLYYLSGENIFDLRGGFVRFCPITPIYRKSGYICTYAVFKHSYLTTTPNGSYTVA
jgi:hypothetical protein